MFLKSGKLARATSSRGQGVAPTSQDNKPHRKCCYCKKTCVGEQMLYQCSKCQAAKYCSKSCQWAHWGKHASLCNAILTLEKESRENTETVFVSHLTPDQHQKVAKLVGKRCTVFCKMNGKTVEALWDTGAQVSITSKDWLENNFPDLQVKSIQCLLDCGPELDLSAANGTKIKYIGYVEIDFRLNSNDSEQQITVPMLVTTDPMECPLIGYNVIQEMVQMNSKTPMAIPNVSLVSSLHDTFSDTESEQVDSLVKIMKTLNSGDGLTPVKTSKSDIIIPKAQLVIIPC